MLEIISDNTDLNALQQKYINYEIDHNEHIIFVDLSNKTYKLQLVFNLTKPSLFKVDYFSLNKKRYIKRIFIDVHHLTKNTQSYIRYHGIGFDDAKTTLQLNSYNDDLVTSNIYSEQEIIQSNFDNAFFSGIPQINANNNSFISAHKLMVGYVNKKELFFLLSLGLNEEKSIQILLRTLYTSFLDDDNLIKDIDEELKNARKKL